MGNRVKTVEAPELVRGPAALDQDPALPGVEVLVDPTQVRRPWRSTVRTVFQALVGLAVILPVMVQAAGLNPETIPWLAGVLGVAAVVTRVMALPAVESWLRKYLPFLAAAPKGVTHE